MPVATWGREHDPRGTLLAPCDGSPCNTAYGDQRQLGHRGRGGLGTFNKLLHGNKNRRPPLQSLLSCPPPPNPPACLQVSAVIRGSPTEVLRVLMDPHSATTILGPALEVEVLDSSPGRQVGGWVGGCRGGRCVLCCAMPCCAVMGFVLTHLFHGFGKRPSDRRTRST